jgi:uncharacterized protein (TIGR00725 family)
MGIAAPEPRPQDRIGAQRIYVAVVGSGRADEQQCRVAEQVGAALAEAGAVLVCGGLYGVMEAACRGASERGGTTVGILPGSDRSDANAFLDVIVPTGLGEARNAVVATASDAVIAVGGEFGTLSEIAFALRSGKPVVGIETWQLARRGRAVEAVLPARHPAEAVSLAVSLVRDRTGSR